MFVLLVLVACGDDASSDGDEPVELGMRGREDELLARLAADDAYPAAFAAAFPEDSAPITVANVVKAIASFQRR